MGCDSVSSRAKIIARKFWLISAQSRWSVNTMIARDFSEMGLIWTRLRWNYNKLKEAWIFCCKSLCFLIVSVGGCYPGDISFLPSILSFTCLSFTTPLSALRVTAIHIFLTWFISFFNTVTSAYRWNCLWCAVDIVVRFPEKHYALYWVHHLSFWHCIFKTWII